MRDDGKQDGSSLIIEGSPSPHPQSQQKCKLVCSVMSYYPNFNTPPGPPQYEKQIVYILDLNLRVIMLLCLNIKI